MSSESAVLIATGDRIVPGVSPAFLLQEHAARYVFAARYCKGRQVLDVASGAGYGTDHLRRSGAISEGLEINPESVRHARGLYPESTFSCGNAEAIPTEWCEKFDCIVSFETIEHLRDTEGFLKGVVRSLRPGGIFICSTPNKNLYLFEGNPFHVKEFFRGEFVALIGSHLRVLEVLGQSFHPSWHALLLTPAALARKLMRLVGIGSRGIGGRALAAITPRPSPFVGNDIQASRVLDEFLPAAIPAGRTPGYLIVVAQKTPDVRTTEAGR